MINQYMTKAHELLRTVEEKETETMNEAADAVAEAIKQDGIIHLFGSGHSHMLAEEVYYRAGGLVPVHPILHEPLMLHQGAVRSSSLERQTDYAHEFMKDQDIRKGDVMFVISTSGRNPVPIDVALLAKEQGAFVIGMTSKEYSLSQPSRHESGKLLYDSVDLMIDNHLPIGDALLSHENVEAPFSPGSTVVGAAILNAIFAQAIVKLTEDGIEPPILRSANIEGADEHNERLIEKYRDRVNL